MDGAAVVICRSLCNRQKGSCNKMPARPSTYSAMDKTLHWTTAVFFILAWLVGFTVKNFHSTPWIGAHADAIVTFHKNIATPVLALSILRLGWRATHPAPFLPMTMSASARKLAHAVHILLYVLLFAVPLSGCLFSYYAGHSIPFLYLFALDGLPHRNMEGTRTFASLHLYLTYAAGIIVFGHIAAALKHHFMDKDDILVGMLPGQREAGNGLHN